jgi:hypothetical protein
MRRHARSRARNGRPADVCRLPIRRGRLLHVWRSGSKWHRRPDASGERRAVGPIDTVPSPVSVRKPPRFRGKSWKAALIAYGSKTFFCRAFLGCSGSHVPLAMQKVEGSNPFSRSPKGLHLQVFFVCAVGWCVCVGGQSSDNRPRPSPASAPGKVLMCRHSWWRLEPLTFCRPADCQRFDSPARYARAASPRSNKRRQSADSWPLRRFLAALLPRLFIHCLNVARGPAPPCCPPARRACVRQQRVARFGRAGAGAGPRRVGGLARGEARPPPPQAAMRRG